MPRHPLILAWSATALLAAMVFLAGPLVLLTLVGALPFGSDQGGAAALLSWLVALLWLAFAVASALTVRAAWRFARKRR